MKSNQYKATITLGMVSLGFLVSYPFRHTFMGGLVVSGCEAAMIGGMADWFAVTALFKKPLGIPFRTAIIPRNRERIFRALSEMVENELLTRENLKRSLERYDVTKLLLKFLNQPGGKQLLAQIVFQIVRDLVERLQPAEVGTVVAAAVKERLVQVKLTPIVADSMEWLIERNYDDKIIDFFIEQFVVLASHNRVKDILSELCLETLEKYERGLNRRILFNQLVNLAPAQVVEMIQKQMVLELNKMHSDGHPLRLKAQKWLREWTVRLQSDSEVQQAIEDWKRAQLDKLDLAPILTRYTADMRNSLLSESVQAKKLCGIIEAQIGKLTADFAQDAEERMKTDRMIKKVIGKWVDAYHGEIGKMVRGSLERFTNEMLVEFIESKVGNDLQMIRINGSVVGGLAGMVLYLMTFWLF